MGKIHSKKRSKKITLTSKKRKLVSPSLRVEKNKKSSFPKIYVINLKRDKSKWEKYSEL